MNTSSLLAGVIFGAFGTGYFVYGKKNNQFIALISGMILMIFPYFIENLYVLYGIGIFLIILPFIIKE